MEHILPLALALATLPTALAQSSCSLASLSSSIPLPSLAPGYSARLVATGLQRPRGIIVDHQDKLLVVEQRQGVRAITWNDNGGNCLSVNRIEDVVNDGQLNHGIELSPDGNTLYASSSDEAYSYTYNSEAHTAENRRTLVTGMDNPDHSTRTLLLSRLAEGMLVVSRGSADNVDVGAGTLESGRSQIRAFNISSLGEGDSYDYTTQGVRLGWGLRNSVGVAEHPQSGGIWSVENSVDNAERLGVLIKENNPGEELNFHGYLNGTEYAAQGGNYGYPLCYATWDRDEVPQNEGIETGTQFAIGTPNNTVNDDFCQNNRIAPRLTFPAHWAPLDIKFTKEGDMAYVTSRGSWNRDQPDGYRVFALAFEDGEPSEPANSTEAILPVFTNEDNSNCPDGCFRPVGLAWDSRGRLFVSADASGEIYVITREDGSGLTAEAQPGSGSGTGSTQPSLASGIKSPTLWVLIAAAVLVVSMV